MEVVISEKQAAYVREAHHRWNLAIGAVRSGKSHMAIRYTIPDRILARRHKKGINLILGATRENIERNVLEPMRSMWGDKFVSDINTRNWATLFGEKVYCLGAENRGQVSKLRGSEVKFCYCDEICDINEEVFELLKSRLSLPYSECHGAANPAGPNHYVKKFIDTADRGVDLYVQHYTIYDNPFLPRTYVDSLEAEYAGTVYFDRYILGLWAQAEGLIYPMYKDALEERFEGERTDYRLSVDYGTQNPFAALKWVKDKEGIWHVVDCYYYSGREEGHQKTDADYVRDLVAFTADAEGADVPVIIDPSAASMIAALRRCADRNFKVIEADNAVLPGIQDTATCLQASQGLVKINKACTKILDEFGEYVWDDKGDSDRPVKENDHAMDAMRYFVRTMRLYKPDKPYTPMLNRWR